MNEEDLLLKTDAELFALSQDLLNKIKQIIETDKSSPKKKGIFWRYASGDEDYKTTDSIIAFSGFQCKWIKPLSKETN